MKRFTFFFLTLFIFLSSLIFENVCFSQEEAVYVSPFMYSKFYTTGEIGLQISGIKREDFIISNVSPLVHAQIGKWITSIVALQIGYKGIYFHTIENNNRHYYNYLHGDVVININELISKKRTSNYFNILIQIGSGYFYNNYYNSPNICANFGVMGNVFLSRNVLISLGVASIIGWDIYQGDEDILPRMQMGFTYLFYKGH